METPVGFEPDLLPDVDTSHRATVERVIAAMRERVNNPLPLRAMAEIAHLSPYHFARTFRRVTGIPSGEFLGALRMERAKQLLLATDMSVAEVCFEVGYRSLGTFTTRFTNLVGLPPGQMRRRLPEELHTALGRVGEEGWWSSSVVSADAGVAFLVHGSDLAGSRIFAGLFPTAIPQGRPVAGTVLTTPGTYRLYPVPDGHYHLMAAALPYSEDPSGLLFPGCALRVGRSRSPLTLRPLQATDPPVLVALPALFLERLDPERGNYQRTAATKRAR